MSETLDRMTIDAMIENYVKLRDKKKSIEEKHKQELAPYNSTMDQLEAWMLEALNQAGLDAMKSVHGTCFKTTRTSAVVRDWSTVLEFIRDNGAWDLLEARVAKKAAFAILEETNTPIPGVDTSSEIVVNVRRAGASPVAGK